jgi:MFS family permease
MVANDGQTKSATAKREPASMTDTSTAPGQPLGIGAIISESFAIFFRRFVPIFLIGFVVYSFGTLASVPFQGFAVATGLADPDLSNAADIGIFLVATVIQGLSYGLAVAVTVLLAYDAKLGRPLRMRGYIGAALSVIVPLFLVSLLVQILIGLGILALVVPGLWLIAVFSVVVPAVVIERAGSGALARSAELTRGYRWPILGLFLIMWLIALGLAAALGAIVLGGSLAVFDVGEPGPVEGLILTALVAAISAIAYGFTNVMVSLLYARLRAIKDGVGVDTLADVFR